MLGVAALSLVACDAQGEENQELRVQTGEQETVSIDDVGDIHMLFSDEETTLTQGDSIEAVLENDTDETLSMGRQYYVEYYENEDTWTRIEFPLFFTADIVMVEPGDEHSFEMLLIPEGENEESNIPEYESGLYRLRKGFSIGDDTASEGYEISVKFDLEVE